MNNISRNTDTDQDLYFALDNTLSNEIDKEIIHDLDIWLNKVKDKSRALASSLKRCFDNARKSMRYVEAYKLGISDSRINKQIPEEKLEKYLEEKLKDFFEKNDFMHYREFVRLLRACTIELGGEVSFEIKTRYKNFFGGKRLIAAYKLGFNKQLNPSKL